MNSRKPIATLVCCGWVLVLALGIYAPQGVAGQVVSGVYKVTETTDLGREVRVRLQIRLMNAGEDSIFVTQVRLRSLRPVQNVDDALSVVLEPHGSAEFTQEFAIAKQEYELWSKGARPHLGLKVHIGERETTMTVTLMRDPGSR